MNKTKAQLTLKCKTQGSSDSIAPTKKKVPQSTVSTNTDLYKRFDLPQNQIIEFGEHFIHFLKNALNSCIPWLFQ